MMKLVTVSFCVFINLWPRPWPRPRDDWPRPRPRPWPHELMASLTSLEVDCNAVQLNNVV